MKKVAPSKKSAPKMPMKTGKSMPMKKGKKAC